MDPDDWQQPQQFRPERFLDESGNVINRDRVIPFSLGASTILLERRCNILICYLLPACVYIVNI